MTAATILDWMFRIVQVFDVLLYPLHLIWHQPWKVLRRRTARRATVERVGDDRALVTPCIQGPQQEKAAIRGRNMFEVLETVLKERSGRKCIGFRQIVGETTERNPDGKIVTKPVLKQHYDWMTSSEVLEKVTNVAAGLKMTTGARLGDKVVIYADTGMEWLVSAVACFKNGYTITTLYTNLGVDGVAYGISQVEAKLVITSQVLLLTLTDSMAAAGGGNKVRNVIYFEHPLKQKTDVEEEEVCPTQEGVIFTRLSEVERLGAEEAEDDGAKRAEDVAGSDVAMIMFTSGSTGNPKGVVLTHDNLIAAITLTSHIMDREIGGKGMRPEEGHCYVAYLPTAHILEMVVELMMVTEGIPVGFSSPFTLTDASPKTILGSPGDATLLRPTLMVAVPLVLDRVYKAARAKVAASGPFSSRLFDMCFEYKRRWRRRGFETPILDAVVFKKLRAVLGGRVEMIFSGGAPMNSDVQEFFRLCVCPKLLVGLGLTEYSGGVTCGDEDDGLGDAGVPLANTEIMIESWEEGGYRVRDGVGCRGEIIVGGPGLARGYYNDDDGSFFVDNRGRRWFRTGDIGQVDRNTGVLRVVDRRKDIVKLQMGEYVSLCKVESQIKLHRAVEWVCAYASPRETATLALVVPNEEALKEMAGDAKTTLADMCADKSVRTTLLAEIAVSASAKLESFEIPKNIRLLLDAWTPDSGLVTSAMKLRRKQIQARYQDHIAEMYEELHATKKRAEYMAYR